MDGKEYLELVAVLVRQKYSVAQEILLLKQKKENSKEYQEYIRYLAECKQKAEYILASP